MATKPSTRKSSGLSMALKVKDRTTINKAAEILQLPPSVWARAELLKAAEQIIKQSGNSK